MSDLQAQARILEQHLELERQKRERQMPAPPAHEAKVKLVAAQEENR